MIYLEVEGMCSVFRSGWVGLCVIGESWEFILLEKVLDKRIVVVINSWMYLENRDIWRGYDSFDLSWGRIDVSGAEVNNWLDRNYWKNLRWLWDF